MLVDCSPKLDIRCEQQGACPNIGLDVLCSPATIACRLVEQLKPFPGMRHVDVAGGTGDVASRVAQSIAAQQSQAMEDDPSSQVPAT